MPGDLAGVILSVVLIGLCWSGALLLKKRKPFGELTDEVARKVVHIGVSNFAFIYLYVFDGDFAPTLGLIAFALVNLWIETHVGNRRSWGTVEYPISIALLILFRNIADQNPVFVACAILGMGYGDGLAAIVGRAVGKVKLSKKGKTLEGSLCVFAVVLLVSLFLAKKSFSVSTVIAVLASLTEVFTPFGLDNVTVPFVIYFGEVLLCC